MKRRRLLASLGAGVSGLAGCSGLLGGEQTPTLTPVEVPPTPTATATTTAVATSDVECPDSGGDARYVPLPFETIPEPAAAFQSLDCPRAVWRREPVCYHTADIESEELLLVGGREATTGGVDGTVLDFVLVNRRDGVARIRPGAWTVLRETAEGWRAVVSGRPNCRETMEDGDVYWWRFGIDRAVQNPWTNVTTAELALSTGVYLLAIPVQVGQRAERVYAAPFALTSAEGTTQDGETATEG
jgi:hypothetical protein